MQIFVLLWIWKWRRSKWIHKTTPSWKITERITILNCGDSHQETISVLFSSRDIRISSPINCGCKSTNCRSKKLFFQKKKIKCCCWGYWCGITFRIKVAHSNWLTPLRCWDFQLRNNWLYRNQSWFVVNHIPIYRLHHLIFFTSCVIWWNAFSSPR